MMKNFTALLVKTNMDKKTKDRLKASGILNLEGMYKS